MSELKPCPFCKAEVIHNGKLDGEIVCENGHKFRYSINVNKTQEAWNTRADTAEIEHLQAEVGKRDKMIADYKDMVRWCKEVFALYHLPIAHIDALNKKEQLIQALANFRKEPR